MTLEELLAGRHMERLAYKPIGSSLVAQRYRLERRSLLHCRRDSPEGGEEKTRVCRKARYTAREAV